MEIGSPELPDRKPKNKMSDWQEISGQRKAGSSAEGEFAHAV